MPSDTYTLTISDAGVSTPADLSVTTAKIVDLNVTTGKIADSAITSAKILDGTIVAGDIADGAITSAKILDGTIVAGDIADGTITSAKIATSTIVAGNLADGAITSAKILDGTIVAGDIAAGAITSAKILDGTIVAGDIADGAITSAKILDGTIIAGDIADGAITSAKILDGTIDTVDIKDSAITSAKILDGTIAADDIANGAITTAKVLDLNITTAKIADGAVTNAKLASGAIAASNIADGTITSAKIQNATIAGEDIASNTVSLSNIVQISDNVILGNNSGTTANISSITCTDLGFSILGASNALGVRDLLGLGGMATQSPSAVDITGGSITGISISGVTFALSDATGILPTTKGGTNISSYTIGDMIYASSPTSFSKLPKSASSTYVLHGAGIGSAPSWGLLNLETDVTGVLPSANGGSGAITNVDTFSFKTVDQTTDALIEGELRWNSTDKTLDLKLAGDVTLQVGQESNIYVHNEDTVQIPNGSVVYISGANGTIPAVKLATNANATAKKTLGIATQNIGVGASGYVTTQGLVRDLNTSSYVTGSPVYLGVAGALTTTEPTYPATAVRMGIVVQQNSSTGSIYTQPQLFSDGRTSGQFTWSGNNFSGGDVTVVGMISSSKVIIQEQGTDPIAHSYSVVCATDKFTPYSNLATNMGGRIFSYIAFI